MGCRGGYLIMLGVKTHCYDRAFSLKSVEDLHEKAAENEKKKNSTKFRCEETTKFCIQSMTN